MTPPPISIDGTDITGATIDGQDVKEITIDGQTVLTAGPPAENDLHARYDATEISLTDGSPVNTWTDRTGNGHDLTAGDSPTYDDNAINGLPAVDFDGIDNVLTTPFGLLSEPITIFTVFRYQSITSGEFEYLYNGETNSGEKAIFVDRDNNFGIRTGGDNETFGAADTNLHISSVLYKSDNNVVRLEGTQVLSGGRGSGGLDGFRIGGRESSGQYANAIVGELLIYPQDKSAIFGDVESFLSSKWGISL